MAWTKIKTVVVTSGLLAAVGLVVIYLPHKASHRGIDYFPRSTWTSAGFATPEATIQSLFWAKSVGDTKTFLACFTPELGQQMETVVFKNRPREERPAQLVQGQKNIRVLRIPRKITLDKRQVAYELEISVEGLPKPAHASTTLTNLDGLWKFSQVTEQR